MSHKSIIDELDQKIQRAKDSLFTGVLAIGINNQVEWFFYFLVGQIVWANAHTHSKRRWHRQFLKYSSHLNRQTIKEIAHQAQNYKTVAQLVMHQKFSREHFSKIVRGCISEVLFDVIHSATLTAHTSESPLIYKVSTRNGANFPCIGLHREPIWEQVQQDWQNWQQANLVGYCPNLAPVITRPEILKERTSSDTFDALRYLANGTQTLRDLAVNTQQPLVALTQSLVPHMRRDLIKLVHVDDLSLKNHPQKQIATSPPKISEPNFSPARVKLNSKELALASCPSTQKGINHGPVITYIDDNPVDSQSMAEIFQGSGYRYVNIADPLKALPKLIELKPQLIFLDLVMPVVNGYELCAQIRRVSRLKEVPVIIMTNNNGIPDRVRAKVVGASGFLGKPIQAKQVLKVVIKHLQTSPATPIRQPYFSRLTPSVVS
ncbi:response regulator [Leptothoe spongobia]|uniref:Response regulator n=1 Tax=Leptothoe spongobia TAU-MAC 1115 TaxID=1967444 RepID=A0A947GM37_9CYAN|nr:response regulator [Leptothoe spongobia]MBT9317427.1 response regulator [Leptothoe spongobia TAU-MAC 1115]